MQANGELVHVGGPAGPARSPTNDLIDTFRLHLASSSLSLNLIDASSPSLIHNAFRALSPPLSRAHPLLLHIRFDK
jgi:hypothetical protein